MKLTTNYSLKKPEGSDVVNIDDFNYNADIIDSAIQETKNTSSTNKTNISSLQAKVNGLFNNNVKNAEPKNFHISSSEIYFNDTSIDRDLNNIRQNLYTQTTSRYHRASREATEFYSFLNVPRGLPVPLLRIIGVYSQGKSDENL